MFSMIVTNDDELLWPRAVVVLTFQHADCVSPCRGLKRQQRRFLKKLKHAAIWEMSSPPRIWKEPHRINLLQKMESTLLLFGKFHWSVNQMIKKKILLGNKCELNEKCALLFLKMCSPERHRSASVAPPSASFDAVCPRDDLFRPSFWPLVGWFKYRHYER